MAEQSPPVLAEDLTVRYGREAPALDRVSMEVAPGQVCALLGRNGAGKTSLVRCLLGQQRPRSGRLALYGSDPWKHRRRLMERVCSTPETPDFPPSMSARQLAAFCSRIYPRWEAAGFERRLEAAAIPPARPSSRLSRGQRAQLALALALAPGPDLLVLDDPTLGLDAVARRSLLAELVGELGDRGTTVLLTSHDLTGVESIADRVVMLRDGRVVVDDDLDTLKSRFWRLSYPHRDSVEPPPEVAALLGGASVLTHRTVGPHTEVVASGGAANLALAVGALPSHVAVEPMSLEQIFLAVCGEAEGGDR